MNAVALVAPVAPASDAGWMFDVLSEPVNRFRLSDRLITYCNDAWAKHYGVRSSDAIGCCLDGFLSPDELVGLHAQLALLGPDDPVLVDCVARVDSGTEQRWLQWVDHYVVTVEGPEIISVGRDVTDRHIAQQALVESERRFRTLADESSDVVWRIRLPNVCFDYVSPSVMEILGVDPSVLVENFDSFLRMVEPETRAVVQRLIDGEELPDRIDLRFLRSDGSNVILESSISRGNDAIQGVGRDVTQIRHLQSSLAAKASTDALTGLANRRMFEDGLAAELTRTAAANTTLAIIYIDLDNLKPVNDHYGHNAGDMVLIEAARRLVSCADGSDLVARVGGDEFVIVHEVRADSVRRMCDRLENRFQRPVSLSESVSVVCPVSIGVADTRTWGHSGRKLVAAADQAMYSNKQQRSGKHPGELGAVAETGR